MEKVIVRYAGKKYGKKHVLAAFNSNDLYYETVVTEGRNGKKKEKKVKKRLPEGLTPSEEALLKKAKKSAWRLDMGLVNILGIRFGWSSVVGIVPGFGDVVDLLLAMQVYHLCCECPDLKSDKKTIMLLNIALDFIIGLVPFLGDLLDGIYKANTRNVSILEAQLAKKGQARIASQQAAANQAAIVENEANTARGGPPPGYTSTNQPATQEPARSTNKLGGISGWFGGRKQPDVEAGTHAPMSDAARA